MAVRRGVVVPMAQGQMTGAVAAMLTPRGNATTRRKRRTTKKKTTTRKRTRRAAPKGRLKKGSPAAKRRMAQLRKMRKKR